jgi:hypothetical protein
MEHDADDMETDGEDSDAARTARPTMRRRTARPTMQRRTVRPMMRRRTAMRPRVHRLLGGDLTWGALGC